MGLEDALEAIGRFGKFQMLHYALSCLSFGLTSTWQLFVIVFLGYINDHHCNLPANVTTVDEMLEYLPVVEDAWGFPMFHQCKMYNITANYTLMDCPDGWHYYEDYFDPNKGTITMEWELICEKDGFVELSLTFYNIGVVVGFFFFTPFGDIIGRKKTFFICQLFMNIFGIVMSLMPVFEGFCAMQFITGALAAGLYMEGMVLGCEMFPTSLRSLAGPITPMFPALGMVTLAGWAYFIRHWRDLQLSVSVAGLFFLPYFFWCPESMRWLMAKGRKDEAEKILQRAAKMNGTKLPEGILDKPDLDDAQAQLADKMTAREKAGGLANFFKLAPTRRYFFVLLFLLLVNNLMYYGLSLMTGELSGDFYTNFAINGALEIPALALAIVAMAFWGRRRPLVFFQLFSAVMMAISAGLTAVEGIDPNIVTATSIIAKFGVAGAWGVELIYGQEMLPTPIRSTLMGIAGGAGFIGSILAPYLSLYLIRIRFWIPGTIFAVLAFVAAWMTLLLPETVGRNLPQTSEEIAAWPLTLTKEEKIRARDNGIVSLFRRRKPETNQVIPDQKHHPDLGAETNGKVNPAYEMDGEPEVMNSKL